MNKYSEEYKENLSKLIKDFPTRLVFNLSKDGNNRLRLTFRVINNKKKLSNVRVKEALGRDSNFSLMPIVDVDDFENIDEVIKKIQKLSEFWLEEE